MEQYTWKPIARIHNDYTAKFGIPRQSGLVESVESVCCEILREIIRVNKAYQAEKYMVYASIPVANVLKADEFHNVAELELSLGKAVQIQAEPLYTQEQFDVVMI